MMKRPLDPTAWHLTKHFFQALFDWGILTEAGADSLKRMLLSAIGVLSATGFLLTHVYIRKYAMLAGVASPDPYRRAVLGDDLFIIGLSMLVVASVTLLISQSLFPDERDFRVLGPLPVRKAVIFGAKLTALFLFSAAVIAVVHLSLAPLMLLTSMNRWREHDVVSRVAALLVASVGASAFTVLAITAVVGVLALPLLRSRLPRLMPLVRSSMLAGLAVCVPLVLRFPRLGDALSSHQGWLFLVPPAWFVGLEKVLLHGAEAWFTSLAGIAVAAASVAAVIVAVSYTLLFRHFERLVLRSRSVSSRWWSGTVAWAGTPAFRAVYGFTITTLRRSPMHQTVLLGLSACGVGIAVNRLSTSSLASAATWVPFALMFACGVALRAALALPMEQRANWIFRVTDDDAVHHDQLRAVGRVASMYVVGVPLALAGPLFWAAFGLTAVVVATVVALVGLVFVHGVLFKWHRIPFTSSYLPGKRFVGQTLLVGVAAFVLFTLAGQALVRAATLSTGRALSIVTALSLLASLLRRRQLAAWREAPLVFEDEFPDNPVQLRL